MCGSVCVCVWERESVCECVFVCVGVCGSVWECVCVGGGMCVWGGVCVCVCVGERERECVYLFSSLWFTCFMHAVLRCVPFPSSLFRAPMEIILFKGHLIVVTRSLTTCTNISCSYIPPNRLTHLSRRK